MWFTEQGPSVVAVHRRNTDILEKREGPTLLRKITYESSTQTQKDFEKANAKVKCSIEREAAKPQKVLPPTTECTYFLYM